MTRRPRILSWSEPRRVCVKELPKNHGGAVNPEAAPPHKCFGPTEDLCAVRQWLALNATAILDHWNDRQPRAALPTKPQIDRDGHLRRDEIGKPPIVRVVALRPPRL
jgi:hypothetical protein